MPKAKKLEELVKKHAKKRDRHVKHYDPLEVIHNHVVAVIFISLMFLVGVFMFLSSEHTTIEQTTGNYVLINYSSVANTLSPMHAISGAATSVSSFVEKVRQSPNRSITILTFYCFWLTIFLIINAAMHERQRRKF